MLVLFFIFHIQGQACACLKISVRTGCIPFMKHSTAMTIRISPIKVARELGSERRETVRSLSIVGVGVLRGAVTSTRGP